MTLREQIKVLVTTWTEVEAVDRWTSLREQTEISAMAEWYKGRAAGFRLCAEALRALLDATPDEPATSEHQGAV